MEEELEGIQIDRVPIKVKLRNEEKIKRNHYIQFIFQIIVLYIIIIAAIINLSLSTKDQQLWIALLSSSIGYLLPNPKLINSIGENLK